MKQLVFKGNYKEISINQPEVIKCAKMIQKHSWGYGYPVNAIDELEKADYIIGCFDKEKLVACGSITRVASPDKVDNGKLWFADAVVLPEYRKLGIYKILYDKRLDFLKKMEKKEKVAFSCTDNLIIEKFLFKRGWVLYRTTKDESGGVCKIFQLKLKI